VRQLCDLPHVQSKDRSSYDPHFKPSAGQCRQQPPTTPPPEPNNALLRAAVDEHHCVKPGWQTRDVQLDGSAYLSHNHAIFRSDERELLQPHPNLTR